MPNLHTTKSPLDEIQKILNTRLPGSNDAHIVTQVTDIARAALKAGKYPELRSIMRKHLKWVEPAVAEAISAQLLETTEVETLDDLSDADIVRT